MNDSLWLHIPLVSSHWRRILAAEAQDIAANGMTRFAGAAAMAVPIWTGYTRAVWQGIADEAASYSTKPRNYAKEVKITAAMGKPWFFPFKPAANHSLSAVIDDPAEEQTRGYIDGQVAFKMYATKTEIISEVTIPDYNLGSRQEHTYALREGDWQSLAAGRIAYDKYEKWAWSRSKVIQEIFEEK